jgi:hypothetical protein
MLALIPAALELPTLASLALVAAVCCALIAWDVIHDREHRAEVRRARRRRSLPSLARDRDPSNVWVDMATCPGAEAAWPIFVGVRRRSLVAGSRGLGGAAWKPSLKGRRDGLIGLGAGRSCCQQDRSQDGRDRHHAEPMIARSRLVLCSVMPAPPPDPRPAGMPPTARADRPRCRRDAGGRSRWCPRSPKTWPDRSASPRSGGPW